DYEKKYNRGRKVTDPSAQRNETTFGYDARGNLQTVTRPSSTGIVETFGYNVFGQMLESFDGEGNRTTYDYFTEASPAGPFEPTTPTTPLRSLDGVTGGYV